MKKTQRLWTIAATILLVVALYFGIFLALPGPSDSFLHPKDPFEDSQSNFERRASQAFATFFTPARIITDQTGWKIQWAMMSSDERESFLFTNFYPIDSGTQKLDLISDSKGDSKVLQELLEIRGIEFPDGSRISFSNSSPGIFIRNTKSNIEMIEEILWPNS